METDSRALLANIPEEEHSSHINEALRYQVIMPYTVEEGQLNAFLAGAQENLIIIGASLALVIEHAGGLITHKISEPNFHLTVLMMTEDIDEAGALYRHLMVQFGGHQPDVARFVETVRESAQFFRDLGQVAGGRLDFRQFAEFPRFGVTIRDHNTTSPSLRVNFYTDLSAAKLHPLLQITPGSLASWAVYRDFVVYYEQLRRRAAPAL